MRGSGSRPGQRGEVAGWIGRDFFLCSVCLSQYYKFRSCLDPETVWRPEGTAAASRREGKEGQDGSSMVSQAQRRALAGQTKPNLVPSYVLTLNARRGCLGRAKSPGKAVGSEGYMGQLEAAQRSVGHASLGASCLRRGERRSRRTPGLSADHVSPGSAAASPQLKSAQLRPSWRELSASLI